MCLLKNELTVVGQADSPLDNKWLWVYNIHSHLENGKNMKLETRTARTNQRREITANNLRLLREVLVDGQVAKGWDEESGRAYANGYTESMLLDVILELASKTCYEDLNGLLTVRRMEKLSQLREQGVAA